MKTNKFFIIAACSIMMLPGCTSSPKTDSLTNELEYGQPVRVTLAWNDNIYELRNEEGPRIIRTDGGRLYAIKGASQQERIAVELSENEYKTCVFLTKIQ